MTNRVHLIFRSINGQKPELLLGDLKRFTSNAVVKAIIGNPNESRKNWMLNQFMKAAAKSTNVHEYQFWRHDDRSIEIWSNKVMAEKIEYIHLNPVKAGFVYKPEDYVYSSAIDYCGEKGMLSDVVIFREQEDT